MTKIWLPIKEETSGRETILYIPGASHLSRQQLEEIIQWQTEKTVAEFKAEGPQPERVVSRKEVGKALKEFRASLARSRETGKPRYH